MAIGTVIRIPTGDKSGARASSRSCSTD
jgi:hypothetical protein